MPDITMCADGKECPLSKDCYRFVAKPNPEWQAYANFYEWHLNRLNPNSNAICLSWMCPMYDCIDAYEEPSADYVSPGPQLRETGIVDE